MVHSNTTLWKLQQILFSNSFEKTFFLQMFVSTSQKYILSFIWKLLIEIVFIEFVFLNFIFNMFFKYFIYQTICLFQKFCFQVLVLKQNDKLIKIKKTSEKYRKTLKKIGKLWKKSSPKIKFCVFSIDQIAVIW